MEFEPAGGPPNAARTQWFARLPHVVNELVQAWSLTLGVRFTDEEGSSAWVRRVVRADGTPAVLMLGIPHMEAEHEIAGLRGIVAAGLELFRELPRTANEEVVLFTDLHAGNVLRAARAPWLAIDPKPFVGDPAYDATQHLFNRAHRMRKDPFGTIAAVADEANVAREHVQLWTFARAAAEPRSNWGDDFRLEVARRLG